MGRRLSPEDLGSRLRARFGDDVEVGDAFGHAVATVSVDRYHDAVRYCRDEPEIGCDFCDFTGGVDFGEEAGCEFVTPLVANEHHHPVRITTTLPPA